MVTPNEPNYGKKTDLTIEFHANPTPTELYWYAHDWSERIPGGNITNAPLGKSSGYTPYGRYSSDVATLGHHQYAVTLTIDPLKKYDEGMPFVLEARNNQGVTNYTVTFTKITSCKGIEILICLW